MASSNRKTHSGVGRKGSSLLSICTLSAALGFTPWIIGADAPWAQFAFRAIGLAALFVVSLGGLRGVFMSSSWAARASAGCFLLVALSALSAAMSVHWGKSLEAMLNLLATAGLFLTAAIALRGASAVRSLALVEVLAAIPVTLVGLAQHFRPDLLPAGNSYPGRAVGPFLQPNRFGGYLIAIIPTALALTFAVQDRWLRAALLIAVFGITFCLVATYSRGSWIGLGIGMVALAAMLLLRPELTPRPILVAATLATLALAFLLQAPSILYRVAPKSAAGATWNLPIDPEREGSEAMRRAIWSGALAASAKRPLLGWGIGAFREAYDRCKSDVLKRLEAEGGRTADQAHSYYLRTLAERGALGLAAFLGFAGIALAAGFAAIRAGDQLESRILVAGLAASVIALLAHAVLEDNLSFVPHGTLLFANLGLLVRTSPGRWEAPSRWARRISGAWAVAAVLGVGLSGASVAAAAEAQQGAKALRMGQVDQAKERYAAATRIAPWNDRYAVAGAEAAEAAARGGRGIDALRDAESSYRRALAVNGSDPVTRHELARLYLAHSADFGPTAPASALHELRLALTQNPYYVEIRNDLGVALLASGDRAGAEEAFRRASQGRRDFVDPILNLATLALRDGNVSEAKRLVEAALERNPGSARAVAMRESISGQGPRG
jgi:O-antigen ligase/Tfp pilus assembly protein PilF